jgi:hypothetical protein
VRVTPKSFQTSPGIPAVAKVRLREGATAKSHRPVGLFNEDTCEIIGVDSPGELLVGVRDSGLSRLEARILQGSSQENAANVSTLETISAYKDDDVLEGDTAESLSAKAKKRKQPLRLRMFRYPDEKVNRKIDSAVLKLAQESRVDEIDEMDYGEGVRVYSVKGASRDAVRSLANFVGTQSLTLFPVYKGVKSSSVVVGSLEDTRFPKPEVGVEYPIVGVIDSGTNRANKRLQAYVAHREDWVQSVDQNNEHGTFVAGIIANARALNHGDDRFPSVHSRIIDVVALDQDGKIAEYDLITVIDRFVRKYPSVKVWNLSLGQVSPCKDHRFSLLGCKLDSIAKKRGVLFVIAAGNYEDTPLRGWPPDDFGEDDRICPPADSVRGLTVGSMVHIANKGTLVRLDDPSPFTRRGPAAHFYIKPEVSHYGGNCDANADFLQTGVVSVSGSGSIAEDIGTSFAAPSISTLAANLFHELRPEDATPTFVKGAIVHSALVRGGRPDAESVRYKGFGSPGDMPDILNCTKSAATVIFHANLENRQFFEKEDFPMPSCLMVPGKGLQAEVFMTLIYDPPTDARFGTEYCRTNVTASLGTLHKNHETGKDEYTPQLRPAVNDLLAGCEKSLISEGFKWSPMKLYYRSFSAGPTLKRWRLHLEILNRSAHNVKEAQPIILFVTIRDPLGKAPVYEEMVAEMERLSWGAQNLRIKSQSRLRAN